MACMGYEGLHLNLILGSLTGILNTYRILVMGHNIGFGPLKSGSRYDIVL